jgi:hypothetical protein
MARLKKNWWVFLLVALAIIWYGVPYAKSLWRREQPYWLSTPGQALRADLRQASGAVLVVGVSVQSILQAVVIIAIERVYARAHNEPEQDVSERGAPLPEQGASTLAELTALDFVRLGEIEGPAGPRKGTRMLHWLFTDTENKVRASVTLWKWQTAPGMLLRSDFADGASVVTYFPLGRHVKRPGLWTDADKQSIEGAYRLHLAHVQEFEQTHGAPVRVTAVRQHLDLGLAFDQHHGRTLWQVFQLPNILSLVSLPLIAAAILFYLLVLPGISSVASVAVSPTSDVWFVSLAFVGGIFFFVIAIVQARRFLASL